MDRPDPVVAALCPGALSEAVRQAAAEVAAVVAGAGSLAGRVRKSDWTAADAAAHLAVTQAIFADLVAGGSHPFQGFEPDQYGEVNARLLADNPARDGAALAHSIDAETARLLGLAAGAGEAGETYDSPLGRMNLETLLSYCMCHLLMHGEGVAVAVHGRSPVGAHHALLALPFLEHSVPFAYEMRRRAATRGVIEFRLRGELRFWMTFDPERAALTYSKPEAVHCHVLTDPRAFVLVALDHLTPLGAMFRGRALAWGTRPWFALELRGLLPGL